MVFRLFRSRSENETKDLFNQENAEDDDDEPIGDTPITSSSIGDKVKPRIENSTLKILVIGDSGTGKTSLLERYSSGKFKGNTTPTIGMDFKVRNIEIGDKKAKVQLFDSAGQAIFRSITNAFYRGTHGILIVFDVTDIESFENVRDWVNNVKQYATQDVVVNLCGNKVDMPRKVTTYEAREYCKKNNYNYFETSAKEGTGVEEAFNDLIEQIKEAYIIV